MSNLYGGAPGQNLIIYDNQEKKANLIPYISDPGCPIGTMFLYTGNGKETYDLPSSQSITITYGTLLKKSYYDENKIAIINESSSAYMLEKMSNIAIKGDSLDIVENYTTSGTASTEVGIINLFKTAVNSDTNRNPVMNPNTLILFETNNGSTSPTTYFISYHGAIRDEYLKVLLTNELNNFGATPTGAIGINAIEYREATNNSRTVQFDSINNKDLIIIYVKSNDNAFKINYYEKMTTYSPNIPTETPSSIEIPSEWFLNNSGSFIVCLSQKANTSNNDTTSPIFIVQPPVFSTLKSEFDIPNTSSLSPYSINVDVPCGTDGEIAPDIYFGSNGDESDDEKWFEEHIESIEYSKNDKQITFIFDSSPTSGFTLNLIMVGHY